MGDFSKLLATNFLTKVAQILGDFLGYFEKPHFKVKTALTTIWATLGNSWAAFYYYVWSHYLPHTHHVYLCFFSQVKHIRLLPDAFSQRTLTYSVRGSVTVRPTSCLTGLGSTKQVNMLLIQHKQSSQIQTK